jgi:molecular chaperone DnaK
MLNRPVGIDLGTTNSAIALLRPEGDDLLLYQDRLRRKTFPSMVGWDPQKEDFITGYEAWNRRVMEPQPVASIKRKMGTQQRVALGPHEMLPEEVSSKILESLVEDMRAFLGDKVDAYGDTHKLEVSRAVVTVPAYFDAPQIEATKRAGELAGLEVLGLLQEPTAAAMYYAWKHGIGDGNFLVYDLGGGTFDVSIIRSLMGEYQVLAIDGDNYLGGDDFDRRLAEMFRKHLVDQGYELDLDVANNDDDRVRFTLLERVAREVKEALTTSEFQYVGRRDLFEDQAGQPVTLDMEVGREEFEELIEDLVDQSIEACERALDQSREQAEIGLSDIDYVLLVGGSTHVPLVQRKVSEALCGGKDGEDGARAERPLIDEPDTCVGLGAAIHAANLSGVTWIDREDDATRRLTITSPLSTRQSSTHVVGRLEGDLPDGIHSAALIGPGGTVSAVTRVRERTNEDDQTSLDFEFDAVELGDPGRHDFTLDFCDDNGDDLVSFDIFLKRLDAEAPYRPTGSALSNPTVLAKDIYLEVASDGAAERFKLLERGTSLPAERSFQFYTADKSGAVLLRLFQNRYPIRTIHLDVPHDTEVGTPVDLTVKVDESMTMVATGEIRGQTFWAQIEPPPERKMRDWAEIEELLDAAEEVREKLWGLEAKLYAKKVDSLLAGIRETARTDPDKLQVLVRRLEGELEDYRTRDVELTPAYSRFQTLLNAIKRVVYRGDDSQPLGRTLDDWRAHLSEVEANADAAWRAKDQEAWSQVFDQVQATWESLAQEEYRFTATNTPEYVQRLYLGLSRRIEELKETLDEFALAGNPETAKLQRREIMHIQAELEDNVEEPLYELDPQDDPGELKPKLARLAEILARLEKRVDELPTLGLVRR